MCTQKWVALMSKIQRMVSLCAASDAASREVQPNFSAWLRKQLLNRSPVLGDMSDRQLVAALHARLTERFGIQHEITEFVLSIMDELL